MTEIPPDPAANKPLGGAERVQPQGPARPEARRESDGVAFRALLERLQTRAAELEREAHEATDPDHLAGADDSARASLEDALSLSDRILEAYREARQQSPENETREPEDREGERT